MNGALKCIFGDKINSQGDKYESINTKQEEYT